MAPAAKSLYRVSVEGEVWVMAESPEQAEREAYFRIPDESSSMELYVYPQLPISLKMVDPDVASSMPWNADNGDERTVGDHLREFEASRAAGKAMSNG